MKNKVTQEETVVDPVAALSSRIDAALEVIARHEEAIDSLRESLSITHGYVRRMGECPGIKLF